MLKIENAEPDEHEETNKSQQLITPFHLADVTARRLACQSRNQGETACRLL
jgi:hypothetical protein